MIGKKKKRKKKTEAQKYTQLFSPSSPSYHNWRFVVVVVMMVDVFVYVMVLVLLVGAESTFRLHLLFGSSFIIINVVVVVNVVILVTVVVIFVIHFALVVVGGVLGRREEILLQPSDHLLFGSGLLQFAIPVLQLVGGRWLLHLAALVVEVRTAAVVGRQVVGARSLVQHLGDAVRASHFQFARLQEHLVGGGVVIGGVVRRTLPAVDVLARHWLRFPPLAVV